MVLFQNMKDEDVIDTILMDFPGLRKLTRESNEKKNFINKHILSAKYAIYHFQPSMSLDDQSKPNTPKNTSNLQKLKKSPMTATTPPWTRNCTQPSKQTSRGSESLSEEPRSG